MKDMSEYLSVLYFTSDLYTVIANFYLKKEEEKNMLMKTEKPEPKSSVTFFLNVTFKKTRYFEEDRTCSRTNE